MPSDSSQVPTISPCTTKPPAGAAPNATNGSTSHRSWRPRGGVTSSPTLASAPLEAVPHVVLERPRDAVEGVRPAVERRPGARLQLEPLAEAVLVEELLAPRVVGDHDLVFRVSLLDQERPREVQIAGRPD